MKTVRVFLLMMILGLGFWNSISFAQVRLNTSNFNNWFVYSGDHKISSKWGLHLEAQARMNGINKWQQPFVRLGVNYHLNSNVFFTAGYVANQTYPYGDFGVPLRFPEHRIYEQLQIKNQINIFEFITRFRLEQRFSKLPVYDALLGRYTLGKYVYTNRVRVMNRVAIPLQGTTIEDKSFYLAIQDEAFINFGKNVGKNIFDQNRFYAGLGYKVPSVGRLELGYMEHTLFKSDGIKVENNHTLQIGLFSYMDLYKAKKR